VRYSASGTVHLSQQFREHTATNRQLIESVYGPDLERVERTLDLQHRMASQVHWMLDTGLAPRTDAERSAFALFHKNFFSFLGVLTLLRGGLFGPARPLLRHVFESQVVAKFCLLSEDESLAIKWLSGDVIYLWS